MTKPLFTTKHYKAIAKWFKENRGYPHSPFEANAKAEKFIKEVFEADNPNFDLEKFLAIVEDKS